MTKRNSRKNIAKYQRIHKLRLEGRKFREIGEELGMSKQRVWQIYDRVSKKTVELPVMSLPSHDNIRTA